MYRRIDNEHEIKEVVCNSLGTDLDLIVHRHHCKAGSVQGCVDYTISTLYNDEEEIEFYELYDEESPYGFLAVNRQMNMLRSFMINSDKRDKEHFRWFENNVKDIMHGQCLVPIWRDNDRAEKFLSHIGEEVLRNDEIIIYKICQ